MESKNSTSYRLLESRLQRIGENFEKWRHLNGWTSHLKLAAELNKRGEKVSARTLKNIADNRHRFDGNGGNGYCHTRLPYKHTLQALLILDGPEMEEVKDAILDLLNWEERVLVPQTFKKNDVVNLSRKVA